MLSLYSAASIDAALTTPLDPHVRVFIEQRIASARANGLAEMTHIIIVQPGDTEADLVAEIGWSPLINPIDGSRFGEPDFVAPWDWLQCHDNGFEFIVTMGNSGFAYVIFVQNIDGVPADLLNLCRVYAPT